MTKRLINLNTSTVDHPGAWPARCQGRSRAALWSAEQADVGNEHAQPPSEHHRLLPELDGTHTVAEQTQ